MINSPENTGWEQLRVLENMPAIPYVSTVNREGRHGLLVGQAALDKSSGDFKKLHHGSIWDFIVIDEAFQTNDIRIGHILKVAISALKDKGKLTLRGVTEDPDFISKLDEIADTTSLDKINERVTAGHTGVIQLNVEWLKRGDAKLKTRRSVSLLLSTLMEH